MANARLKEAYERIVEEGSARGSLDIREGADELRGAPRFPVARSAITVRIEPRYDLANISASGISFDTDRPFQGGDTLQLILENALMVQAAVVDCTRLNGDPPAPAKRYRVHCRFRDAGQGEQLIVMLNEMSRLSLRRAHAAMRARR